MREVEEPQRAGLLPLRLNGAEHVRREPSRGRIRPATGSRGTRGLARRRGKAEAGARGRV